MLNTKHILSKAGVGFLAATLAAIAASAVAEEQPLKQLLPRLAPLEPGDALKSFQIEQGFRIELVAAEPDVVDPIALAFDEHQRIYVCEDIDYPFPAAEGKAPLGRVRLLEDEDRDGRYERGTIFADKVHWPSGVVCWQGGVFVAAPPQILYLKDTDGDRRADVRKVVFDGFGTATAEDIMNNLKWGPDNRIYGVASYNGGEIRSEGGEQTQPISVRGSSFRFDPITLKFERLPGTGDFGNCFDDWGNRFVTNAGQLLMHPVYNDTYLARNPHLHVTDVLHRCASSKRDMHSISPPEPWRVVRKQFWQRWVNKTHNMRASRFSDAELAERGFVTGAAGAAIYRGGVFPAEYRGNSFTAEPAGNVVIRLRVERNGVTFNALPTSDKKEFLTSRDNWFRPVNIANGPDGCLYVCDMYRELIEDPSAIPEDILELMDVTSGRDRGRIYRIVPPSFNGKSQASARKETAFGSSLNERSTAALVAELENSNAWVRETAQRLLVERKDKAAMAPLRELIAESGSAQSRLHALWTLEGLGANNESSLLLGLNDKTQAVRENAVRISERHMNTLPRIAHKVATLSGDEDARVRYQVAFTLGELRDRGAAVRALAEIAKRDSQSKHIRTAIVSSVSGDAGVLLETLANTDALGGDGGQQLLGEIVGLIATQGDQAQIDRALALVNSEAVPASSIRLVMLRLGDSLSKEGGSLSAAIRRQPLDVQRRFEEMLKEASNNALIQELPIDRRRQAIELLQFGDWKNVNNVIGSLMTAQEPPTIQLAGIQVLSSFDEAGVASKLIESWRNLSPQVRGEASEAMLSRTERAAALLAAIRDKKVPAANLEPARQQQLLRHSDEAVRRLAAEVFSGSERTSRAKVVENYRSVLKTNGDAQKGAAVFKANCATCHAGSDTRKAVGPDLATVQNRSPEQLLLQILDPNREVKPQYLNYQVVTKNGLIKSGIIAHESESSITLRRAEGAEDVISREAIESLTSSGLSLMPEGLEKDITKQQMADLLAHLKSLK